MTVLHTTSFVVQTNPLDLPQTVEVFVLFFFVIFKHNVFMYDMSNWKDDFFFCCFVLFCGFLNVASARTLSNLYLYID